MGCPPKPQNVFLTLRIEGNPHPDPAFCISQAQLRRGPYPAPGPLCLNRLAYLGHWEGSVGG